jgi:hypothetical protein
MLLILSKGAVSTCETSTSFYETVRPKIPEDRHLHTRPRVNLESHVISVDVNLRVDVV